MIHAAIAMNVQSVAQEASVLKKKSPTFQGSLMYLLIFWHNNLELII
jgi:hypothetical protein